MSARPIELRGASRPGADLEGAHARFARVGAQWAEQLLGGAVRPEVVALYVERATDLADALEQEGAITMSIMVLHSALSDVEHAARSGLRAPRACLASAASELVAELACLHRIVGDEAERDAVLDRYGRLVAECLLDA